VCGITGIYITNNKLEVQKETLIKMRDTLIHRGPDDEGLYLSKDKKVGFGFRRLSIIDLSKNANQPMANKDKTIQLVFNGEIYNFQEIKKELIQKGYEFKSKTDSEVLLHLYEDKGKDCLKDLNGMFAFVIWNDKKKELFVARDRLGIKPFYYYYKDGIFLFGSEIKAILQHPIVKREPDKEGIFHYLTFACTPAPFTLFKNIRKLPAAHYLSLDIKGNLEIKRYWSPLSDMKYTGGDYIQKTQELLKDSIEKQMVSDVPFGCFLSGGIDSSTNAVLMSQAMGKPVDTFSISFKDLPKYDEFEYSRQIVKLLDSKCYETIIGQKEFIEWLPKLAYYADDPNGDPVCFPVYYLSKLIHDSHVIMAQVGEGSDELFCGYGTYMEFIKIYQNYWRYLEKLPQFIKKIPYSFLNFILPQNKLTLHKEFFRRLAYNKPFFFGGANAFSAYDKQFLMTDNYKKQISFDASDELIEHIIEPFQKDSSLDFLQKMLYLELSIRLPELLLMRVDKMASAHSIETRVPFLDHRLVELAFSIPMNLKIKGKTTKYILKKAVQDIIPDEIINRKKKGFGAPTSEWMRKESPISNQLVNIIHSSKLKELDIFDYNYIEQLINDHQSNVCDNSFKLWNLITLSLWYDEWIC
jgi:asparagine synthase (glutamine-hydrolysing)